MNNFIILPIILPLITGILLIFLNKQITIQKWLSGVSSLTGIVITASIVQAVYHEGIQTLEIGNWKPPFGIVLVADMYSSLLVLTTNIIVFACFLFAFRSIGLEREKFFFYPGVMFLLTGVSGAFLTGDIFNLFVFFEVMLMASYFLIVHGNTKVQLRESIKYILVNVISSALFVISVAYLYAVTGTLNMADLSVRVAEMGQSGIISVISIMFLIVFGLKGAIFPLFFWLPGSYQAPPSAITALFGALLTKVGVYSITRVFTLIFIHDTSFTHEIIAWLAILTILFGVIGAIAFWDIRKIIIYNIITAVGVILFGVSMLNKSGIEGSIYYIIHDMIIKGALFLLVGAMIVITGTSNLRKMGGLIKNHPFLGWMFFIAALALAGIPPLSGFVGKLKIVQSGFENNEYVFAFVVLLSSLFVLYSVMKIFINGFWNEQVLTKEEEKGSTKGLLLPIAILLTISILYGLSIEMVSPYVTQASETLLDPSIYIEAVLKE
ncbi:Na+/H+ antiporter subunit D [Bacillus alveayuensis]|jgi:multicomponent Na+:H+ antiporter subunit D|uniref:Na+/H+ antiporter subunit D n=1 Tax=Aeribacillus alveayuensis TaxID=279215 RepID=UPI0005D1016A|nr:Na+/H+ antiporter subunit D [Bacillus alveayuensis]